MTKHPSQRTGHASGDPVENFLIGALSMIPVAIYLLVSFELAVVLGLGMINVELVRP